MIRRTRILLLASLTVMGTGAGGCAYTRTGTYSASASYSVSTGGDYFYDALAPYGTWVEVSSYGRAWCPLDVEVGWRPYTVGYWAYTDFGWMWISQDPWGHVPYHYGRWAFDSYYGWVWVPGDVWAPAWVAWRYGDGWAGWAPLPPDVGWRVGVGLTVDAYALDSRIDPYSWCFAPARDITTRTNIRTRLAPPSRNVTFISVTQNVTNYTVINSRPAERGFRAELIEREVGRKIAPYHIVDERTPRGSRGAMIRGRNIEVYRPTGDFESGLKERIRTERPERAAPPRELVQRQEVERRRFDERMWSERAALKREHQRELREPPRGASREQLARRHEAELRAQEEREERERKAINERSKRIKKRAQDEEARANDRDRGRGRGRGRGGDAED